VITTSFSSARDSKIGLGFTLISLELTNFMRRLLLYVDQNVT
jgi:hypothetical protein